MDARLIALVGTAVLAVLAGAADLRQVDQQVRRQVLQAVDGVYQLHGRHLFFHDDDGLFHAADVQRRLPMEAAGVQNLLADAKALFGDFQGEFHMRFLHKIV